MDVMTDSPDEGPATPTIEDVVAAVEQHGEHYVIVRDGEPVAVVVNHDDWQALVNAVRHLEGGN